MLTKLTVVLSILTRISHAKKLVVTTGLTQSTEVIDIDEATNICTNLQVVKTNNQIKVSMIIPFKKTKNNSHLQKNYSLIRVNLSNFKVIPDQ